MQQIIPLTNNPNQTFTVTLNVDNSNLTLTMIVRYNVIADYWVLTIINTSTQETILDSIPFVTGVYPASNILEQYAYLQIGSAYIINTDNAVLDYPDDSLDSLGSDFVLLWSDTPSS
jgi:hypothetical protein